MLTVILLQTLRSSQIGILLGLTACVMVAGAAAAYLEPVTALLDALQETGTLDGDMIAILLKAVGIGLVTEIASMICTDSGNASLGKTFQLLGTAVILWLSIPLFTGLLELIQEILGA